MLISYTSQNKVCCSYSQSLSSWGGSWPRSSFVFALLQNPFPDLFLSRTRGIGCTRGHGRIGLGGQYNEVFPCPHTSKNPARTESGPSLVNVNFFILIPPIKPRNWDHCPAHAHTVLNILFSNTDSDLALKNQPFSARSDIPISACRPADPRPSLRKKLPGFFAGPYMDASSKAATVTGAVSPGWMSRSRTSQFQFPVLLLRLHLLSHLITRAEMISAAHEIPARSSLSIFITYGGICPPTVLYTPILLKSMVESRNAAKAPLPHSFQNPFTEWGEGI